MQPTIAPLKLDNFTKDEFKSNQHAARYNAWRGVDGNSKDNKTSSIIDPLFSFAQFSAALWVSRDTFLVVCTTAQGSKYHFSMPPATCQTILEALGLPAISKDDSTDVISVSLDIIRKFMLEQLVSSTLSIVGIQVGVLKKLIDDEFDINKMAHIDITINGIKGAIPIHVAGFKVESNSQIRLKNNPELLNVNCQSTSKIATAILNIEKMKTLKVRDIIPIETVKTNIIIFPGIHYKNRTAESETGTLIELAIFRSNTNFYITQLISSAPASRKAVGNNIDVIFTSHCIYHGHCFTSNTKSYFLITKIIPR